MYSRDLGNFVSSKNYKEVFVNLGKEYMLSIKGFEKLFSEKTRIIIAEGRIGDRMKLMKDWILKISGKSTKYQSIADFI